MIFGASAQTEKGLFFDANAGVRLGGETSSKSTVDPGFHLHGGVGYMFNNFIGVQGKLGFNTVKAVNVIESGVDDRSYLLNITAEAVLGVSELAGFGTEKFDLFVHAGGGISTIGNPGYKRRYEETREWNDKLFKGNDDSFNAIFGITPKYHLDENISFSLDIAYFMMFNQTYSLDREIGNTLVSGSKGMTNISLGITYKL